MGVIVGGGHFHPVTARSPDAKGNNYDISVPFDRDFYFVVRPVGLSVIDLNNNNASVDGGQSISLHQSSANAAANAPTASAGGSAPVAVLNYRVTGKK